MDYSKFIVSVSCLVNIRAVVLVLPASKSKMYVVLVYIHQASYMFKHS